MPANKPMTATRSDLARSLAKALAYKDCGKQAKAEFWAMRLVEQLECRGVLLTTTDGRDDE